VETQDATSERAVTIHLKDIAFAPAEIRIRRGTTVTWINDDAVDHYVNTDAHPSHTYVLGQNSKVLKSGESFQFSFANPGIYPYHCSAHADVMRGVLLVE
jgi:plastocyanin